MTELFTKRMGWYPLRAKRELDERMAKRAEREKQGWQDKRPSSAVRRLKATPINGLAWKKRRGRLRKIAWMP